MDRTINQYGHLTWTSQNGLPGEAVYETLQTSDGYLWLRTSAGLVRFDGIRFVRIDPRADKTPFGESVRAIFRTANGGMLVRGTSKTLLYRDGAFSSYVPPMALRQGSIRRVFETREHQVWIGLDNFVYTVRGNRTELVKEGTGWVDAFLQDRAGNLWIGGGRALYRYRNGALSIQPTLAALSVPALLEDHAGGIWIGTSRGLYRMQQDAAVPAATANELMRAEVSALLEDRQGNIWVGTSDSGLYRLSGGKWSRFTHVDGLSDDAVLSLAEDREGDLWVGTASGLEQFRDVSIATYTSAEGIVSNDTSTVLASRAGEIYIFSQGAGLTRLKDGSATLYTAKEGLTSPFGGALFESKDGSLWIGTAQGLCRLKDGKLTTFTAGGRLAGVYIPVISEDSEGLIVATSNTPVFRFNDGRLSEFTVAGHATALSEPGQYIFTIHPDESGALWFGTLLGLYRIAPGQAPLGPRQLRVEFPVTTIYADRRGSLWLGGRIPGITRLHIADGKITRYALKQGLFDDFPTHILGDSSGGLWISAPRGTFAVSRADLDGVADGRLSSVRAQMFDTADGMKTSEASLPEKQPAGSAAPDGKLWFTTRKGVVEIDPAHIRRNPVLPPVIIEELLVDGRSLPVNAATSLPPGTDKLEFRYTALSLQVPSRVRFKYQLEGYDRDWIDAGTQRMAHYTKLPPGAYRFRVLASNNDGLWSKTSTAVRLTVAPRFYQTAWFIVLCIAAVFLAARGWHVWRVKSVKRLAETLREQVAERTRDLEATNRELKETQSQLLITARRAGMAEIANDVLHNVGNVLNSMNVSAHMIQAKLHDSRIEGLTKAVQLMNAHAADLADFLTRDTRGKALQPYLNTLVVRLADEKQGIATELECLTRSIDHIKEIVVRQQSHSGATVLVESVRLEDLLEQALHTCASSLARYDITVVKEIGEVPPVQVDKHLVLQILVNLIENSAKAMDGVPERSHQITVKVDVVEISGGRRVRIRVTDNGEGIAPQNLTRLFTHGFTTRANGHGFGLHSCALAAEEMGGTMSACSDGIGKGATFTLELPLKEVEALQDPGDAFESAVLRA